MQLRFFLTLGLSFLVTGCSLASKSTRSPIDEQPHAAQASPRPNPWANIKTPSHGSLGPIGSYSAGCNDGAKALDLNGPGFQVMRPSRNRFYGNTELVNYIKNLTDLTVVDKVGVLLIGDMSMPRGGPLPTGHMSHQIGLDVDIWYVLYPVAQQRPLTPEERETVSAVSFVNLEKQVLKEDLWTPAHESLLRLAATQPEVERIFVNPAIKRALCQKLPERDRAWLHRLRPWFGHDDHFHVRLKCPAGAELCKNQEPVAPGDGCVGDDLAWWFTQEARDKEKIQASQPPLRTMPVLPAACTALLN